MMKNRLLIILILSAGIFGQSIQDLMEQAGVSPPSELANISPKGTSDVDVSIPSEIPVQEVVKLPVVVTDSTQLEYFGYQYFSNKSEHVFLDNLPAPANYRVGAGDEIIITIWGETQLREKSTISRDGSIYFENVGLVNLTNLSLEQAKKVLKSRFENVYSTLRGGKNASTFMEISLGTLKSINIHFLGEVNSPGVLPIHPFSTVTTGLLQAGGVSLIGSLRDIRIIRNGRLLKSIDYYQYLLDGSIENNVRLIDNDVISIPVRKSSIQIKGKVRRPGIFELKEGETLRDLVKLAGGLENDAESKIEIKRVLPLAFRATKTDDIQRIWVDLSKEDDVALLDGDRINVFSLFETDQVVHISGKVNNPGEFSLSSGMKLTDLLELAGGVFTTNQWPRVYPFRADLVRYNRHEATSHIFPIKLDALKAGDQSQDLTLQDGDKVYIYPTELNKYSKVVEIYGDIRNPGEYDLDENMGLTDLILRAGGFSYSAYPAEVVVNSIDPFSLTSGSLSTELKVKIDPNVFNNYPELDAYKLKHKDQVFVRKHPEFQFQRNVSLEGEVKFPGIYALNEKNETVGNLIQRAGGFTEEAFVEAIQIHRNEKRLVLEGEGRRQAEMDLPLLPGDEIVVPRHSNTVEVRGEVNSPGLVHFNKGLSVSDYINIAGNYTLDGDKKTVAIYYPNGESKSRGFLFDPKVREGSVIVVYKKPVELPLDKTVYFTEITTMIVQALSLLLVADRLTK